jgi:hypothetical protein
MHSYLQVNFLIPISLQQDTMQCLDQKRIESKNPTNNSWLAIDSYQTRYNYLLVNLLIQI